MKKVFQVLLVLAIAAVVFGYFRNWYAIYRVNEERKTNITISIDRQRIEEDLHLAVEKAKNVGGRIRSGSSDQPQQESGAAGPNPP